jgi:hypothetical protein
MKRERQLPTTFQGICLQCIETNHLDVRNSGNLAKRFIFGNKSTVRPWVDRALRQDFPPIRIVEVEESSDSSETREEEMQETARATDVEMKDPPHQWQHETRTRRMNRKRRNSP